jgi:hypothetical protein
MTAHEVLVELSRIGRANMADFVRAFFGCRDPVAAVEQLTPAQTAALIEVTVDQFKDGAGEDGGRCGASASSWCRRSRRWSCSASNTSSTSSGTSTTGAPASPTAWRLGWRG